MVQTVLNEVIESYYCIPLSLLKVRGRIFNSDVSKIKIYCNKRCLGEAKIDIFAFGIYKGRKKGQRTWVFTDVIKKQERLELLTVKMLKDRQVIFEQTINVTFINEIPEQFVSSIGTKNGITVNDEEQEFCDAQYACDFKPPLKFLTIESSSLCNLRCKYCVVSNNYEKIDRGIITNDILSKAIESVNEFDTISTIQLSGLGEPLVNPNFIKMVERIHNETTIKNLKFFTNGMLLTKEVSDALSKIPLKTSIFISIDGRTPRENNTLRKGSDYNTVKDNLFYFLRQIREKKNFRVKIHNLIVDEQDSEINVPKFLLRDFGFIGIDTHKAFYFPDLSEKTLNNNHIKVFSNPNKKVCRRTFSQTTIRSNGDVIRCHWDSTCKMVMGNVLTENLTNIWHGEKYIDNRKLMMPDISFSQLPNVCQNCHAMNEGYLYTSKKHM